MLQMEQDYNGRDFNVNLKGVNPSVVDGTGIFIGSYLQSVSQNLALGAEAVYQRPTPGQQETVMSYVAKYTGRDYIATAQYQGFGAFSAAYYLRYSEKVDFGTEIQLLTAGGRREAVATVGGKFEFRRSTFRGQVDTTGKVSAVLEEKIVPGFSFLVSGEMDHGKVIILFFVFCSLVAVVFSYSKFSYCCIVANNSFLFDIFYVIIGSEQIRCWYDVGGLKRGSTHILFRSLGRKGGAKQDPHFSGNPSWTGTAILLLFLFFSAHTHHRLPLF